MPPFWLRWNIQWKDVTFLSRFGTAGGRGGEGGGAGGVILSSEVRLFAKKLRSSLNVFSKTSQTRAMTLFLAVLRRWGCHWYFHFYWQWHFSCLFYIDGIFAGIRTFAGNSTFVGLSI